MCDRLLAEGHTVVGLDNFLTGAERNLAHLNGHSGFEFIRQDVTQPFTLRGPVDAVLHMASPASPKDYLEHPIETLDVGSVGTRVMLELARSSHARFLLTSTSETYGDPLVHPQVETYWGNVNPVGPRSCYDESKRFAEAMTMAYHRTYNMRTNIAHFQYVRSANEAERRAGGAGFPGSGTARKTHDGLWRRFTDSQLLLCERPGGWLVSPHEFGRAVSRQSR